MKKYKQLRNPLRDKLISAVSKQLRYQIEIHIWYWSSNELWVEKLFSVKNSLNDSLKVE